MTPDPAIRLQSVIHTLERVIIPAVDTGNLLAVEQCGVTVAQLRMLLEHLPLLTAYHGACVADLVATAQDLPEPDGGPQTLAAAARLGQVLTDRAATDDDRLFYHRVGKALEDLLRAVAGDGAPAYRRAIDRAVLTFSRRQSLRSRSWFVGAGFDPKPAELPPVTELI
ncbi:hypothetical protein [Novosphingobium colocasiae]|uniref:hypothetical protein n=1 Tax=Novosphingobium colocasiae TaxID=1256513 RepID=UPI0035B1915C